MVPIALVFGFIAMVAAVFGFGGVLHGMATIGQTVFLVFGLIALGFGLGAMNQFKPN